MLAVTCPLGYVILRHRPNEATNENWVGLQEWNFAIEKENFINNSRHAAINATHELAGNALIVTELHGQADWQVVKIKKLR
jgi:hypothetical protein